MPAWASDHRLWTCCRYATFCKLAGVDPADSGPGRFPVDSLDVLPVLFNETADSPHEHIPLGFNFTLRGALLSGDYKLIVGSQGAVSNCDTRMYSPLDCELGLKGERLRGGLWSGWCRLTEARATTTDPCSKGPSGVDCDPYCLFNVVQDPEERHELSKTQPDVLQKLLAAYNAYSKEDPNMQDQGIHFPGDMPVDPHAEAYMAAHGRYWQPWKEL